MPAGGGLAPPTDVPNGECRDDPPELVIRRKHPVVAVPVLPRRRDEIRQTIEELKRREVDDAIGCRLVKEDLRERRDGVGPPCGRRRLRAGNPVTAATMGGPAGGRRE
jgi:hypothetical protein